MNPTETFFWKSVHFVSDQRLSNVTANAKRLYIRFYFYIGTMRTGAIARMHHYIRIEIVWSGIGSLGVAYNSCTRSFVGC